MVHAQQIEKDKLKEKSWEAKKAKTNDETSLHRRPIDMVILSSKKGFMVKVPSILLLSSRKMGFLTLSFK